MVLYITLTCKSSLYMKLHGHGCKGLWCICKWCSTFDSSDPFTHTNVNAIAGYLSHHFQPIYILLLRLICDKKYDFWCNVTLKVFFKHSNSKAIMFWNCNCLSQFIWDKIVTFKAMRVLKLCFLKLVNSQ